MKPKERAARWIERELGRDAPYVDADSLAALLTEYRREGMETVRRACAESVRAVQVDPGDAHATLHAVYHAVLATPLLGEDA